MAAHSSILAWKIPWNKEQWLRPSRQPVGTDWRGRPMVSTPCGPMAIMALVHLYLPQVSLSCLPPSHSCAVCFAHVGMENPGRGAGCTQPRWNRAQSTGPGRRKSIRSRVRKFPDQPQGSDPAGSYKDWAGWGAPAKGETGTQSQGPLGSCGRAAGGGGMGTKAQLSTHKPVGHLHVSLCVPAHTHAPRSAHVFLLHVFVGRVCVGTCMHVRVGSARGLPGSVSPLCV